MYVITGATGHTGRRVAEMLLERGNKVRVIGRSAERLKPLSALGAEAIVGDQADVKLLERAFTGATAVYAIVPPNPAAVSFRTYQNQLGEALTTALRSSGTKWIVNLSSLGAHLPEKVGPVNGLFDHERRLEKLGVNVLHLRPTYFMENILWNIGTIKQMGMNGGAIAPNVKMPLIATEDIATIAVDHLQARDFGNGVVRELLGPRDYTMTEVTGIIGQAIGKPDLKYAQFPYADAEKAMVGMGLSADVAKNYSELSRAINEGIGIRAISRTPRSATPTRFEQFVESTFLPAYRA